METLEDKIALAHWHVEEGRRIVEQQRKLIAEKHGGPDALDLLRTFERSLAIFEGDLERLIQERERK